MTLYSAECAAAEQWNKLDTVHSLSQLLDALTKMTPSSLRTRNTITACSAGVFFQSFVALYCNGYMQKNSPALSY